MMYRITQERHINTIPAPLPTYITIFAVACVIGVFLSVNRHSRSERMRYWVTAWGFVLVHFMAQFASGQLTGAARKLVVSVSTSALELAGVALLLSFSITFEGRKTNRYLGAIIAVPLLICVNCLVWNVGARWIYLLCIVATTGGSLLLYVLFLRRLSGFLLLIAGWCVFTAVWLIRAVLAGDAILTLHYSLTGLYGISGLIFWRCYRRLSARSEER